MMRRAFGAGLALACLALAGCRTTAYDPALLASPDRLQPPFDIARLGPAPPPPDESFACKRPPNPVRSLTFDGFYSPGSGSSVVDDGAMKRYRAARKPVDDFERGIIDMGDRYLGVAPRDPAIARCVLDWLHRWAQGGGYQGAVSSQGGFVRKWSLGTVSLAWLKIRAAPGLDPAKTADVLRWIGTWALTVKADYEDRPERSSRNNNHAYWASWSVGLAAVALNNRDLFGWMVRRQGQAMRQIRDDGTLLLEMARRSKALHYHVYSIKALAMIAHLAARNGIDLYGLEDRALHRLVARVLPALDDPSFFEEATGEKQSWVGSLNGGTLAWMEAWNARFDDPAVTRWIERLRPMKDRRIGGDATLLYGRQEDSGR